MVLEDIVNAGFTYGDAVAGCKAAVADIRESSASGLRHSGFESDDFLPEPFGFVSGVAMSVFASRMD